MSWIGKTVHRKEDDRLIRGKGLFVDDYKMGGMLHMKLVTSSYAHATIGSIDVSAAEAMPGVVCTLTGAEVAEQTSRSSSFLPIPAPRSKTTVWRWGRYASKVSPSPRSSPKRPLSPRTPPL